MVSGYFLAELLKNYFHKEADVTLDPDTAHPRLEVSEGGKCVRDTGAVRNVPNNEKRFDSQMFVLASEGFASGKHYWEVDIGKKSNWELGVAREDVSRKGKITLSPKNGYWVIGLTDGKDYWACTDPWTRLTVSGKPSKIGMFLDMSAGKLSFYNVDGKFVFYTFTDNFEEKLYFFFSTGSAVTRDTEPLKIFGFEKQ
ncbi:E3 ubiquitin-protein ligase TRIM39-like [Gopherus evgoodei]|uniref:E3 ubiquitin-protein ligase TRIM39-like n=1 Tax=Gopherus evgoodei TaxID=1825980 RepID=UPI0011CEE32C|nr:E3 ubiquitin-protein ligase TRIM39-like [Gopherus evgoodei]